MWRVDQASNSRMQATAARLQMEAKMDQQPQTGRTASEGSSLPPIRIGEVVLKTARYDEMNRWWQTVLGIEPYLKNEQFSFRRLSSDYPYTQLILIMNRPELSGRDSS